MTPEQEDESDIPAAIDSVDELLSQQIAQRLRTMIATDEPEARRAFA
jgi:hypothetical protein